jgi:heme/copper-type cytochrome/quinol oxidase subunit 3
MPATRSRTAHPVVDRTRGLTMGMWGAILLLIVLTTALAGVAAAGLYLHTGQPAWPPAPLERPGSWPAVIAVVLALAGNVAATAAAIRLRADARPAPSLLLLISGALLTTSVVVLGRDIASVPFHWADHAYASVYVILTAIAAFFVAVSVLMVAALLVQRLVGVIDSGRMLEADITVVYLWWALPAMIVCLGVVHLLPDPGGAM